MITVTMHKNMSGLYQGFNIHGHADGYQNDAEYDLICASVSAITLTIASGLQDVLHLDGSFDSDYGFMNVELTSEPTEKSEILIRTMIHGLKSIEKQYPEHLKILE